MIKAPNIQLLKDQNRLGPGTTRARPNVLGRNTEADAAFAKAKELGYKNDPCSQIVSATFNPSSLFSISIKPHKNIIRYLSGSNPLWCATDVSFVFIFN
jgi:hypothetical protein